MPKIEPPTPTPLPDQAQADKAKRRLVAKEQAGSGSQSTILSTGGRETLGG
ncbi:hypothetical protein [Profundibacter sp.]